MHPQRQQLAAVSMQEPRYTAFTRHGKHPPLPTGHFNIKNALQLNQLYACWQYELISF